MLYVGASPQLPHFRKHCASIQQLSLAFEHWPVALRLNNACFLEPATAPHGSLAVRRAPKRPLSLHQYARARLISHLVIHSFHPKRMPLNVLPAETEPNDNGTGNHYPRLSFHHEAPLTSPHRLRHPILDCVNFTTLITAATNPIQPPMATNWTLTSSCPLPKHSQISALHSGRQVPFDPEEIPPVPGDDENANLDTPIHNVSTVVVTTTSSRVKTAQGTEI